jgi:hypothetical protein
MRNSQIACFKLLYNKTLCGYCNLYVLFQTHSLRWTHYSKMNSSATDASCASRQANSQSSIIDCQLQHENPQIQKNNADEQDTVHATVVGDLFHGDRLDGESAGP